MNIRLLFLTYMNFSQTVHPIACKYGAARNGDARINMIDQMNISGYEKNCITLSKCMLSLQIQKFLNFFVKRENILISIRILRHV